MLMQGRAPLTQPWRFQSRLIAPRVLLGSYQQLGHHAQRGSGTSATGPAVEGAGARNEQPLPAVAGGVYTPGDYGGRLGPVRRLLLEIDPGLNQTLISSGTSISQLFNQDRWEAHRK